ncbi:hypothetical protein Hanom_Chr09g00816701 [Helianthus anomalus]
MKNSQYTGRPPISQPFRPQSMVGTETDSYVPPPGFQTKGNMTLVTDGQRTTGQTYIPPPTYTDMPHGADTIGIGNDNPRLVTGRGGVQRPTFIDVGHHGNNSIYTGSKGVVNKNIVKDVRAPGFTDQARPNATLAAGELIVGRSTPMVDQYGGVVISVVGKKFREVNLTAYYEPMKNVI